MRLIRFPCIICCCFAALLLITGQVHAQTAAPEIDPTPFARPVALASGKTVDASATLSALKAKGRELGFEITDSDNANLMFTLERKSNARDPEYDRVIVWLENDPLQPTDRVRMYLLYGRFEQVWTRSGKSLQRVVVSADLELAKIGELKRALKAIVDPQS